MEVPLLINLTPPPLPPPLLHENDMSLLEQDSPTVFPASTMYYVAHPQPLTYSRMGGSPECDHRVCSLSEIDKTRVFTSSARLHQS